MKYDELEKKIAEVFKDFELECVKLEYFKINEYDLVALGDKAHTEITIVGVVKEKK